MRGFATMPQCVAARTSWFTGRMSKEHGAATNSFGLNPTIPDLGQWLRDKGGYETVYTGKWHVNNRDVSKSFRVLAPGPWGGLGTGADLEVTRASVAFLRQYTGQKPFFLSAGLINPHDCCYLFGRNGPTKAGFEKKIAGELPPLPSNFDWTIARSNQQKAWTEEQWHYYLWGYYRLCEMVDAQIGRIYDELRHSRFADNTLFLFTADHGDGAGHHGKTSKGYMFDESWRVPTMAAWPGRIPPSIRDEEHLASGVDIPATICDYAGVEPLPKMTIGKSWKPIFEGRASPWRDYVVGETRIGALRTAFRDKTHKTVFYQDGAIVYNMVADPLETKDLSHTPEGRQVIDRHLQYFREYVNRIEPYRGPAIIPRRKEQNVVKALSAQVTEYVKWYDAVKEGKFNGILALKRHNEGILGGDGSADDE